MMYARPTQPSSIGEILADGFSLFQASIRSVYAPTFVLALIIGMMNVSLQPRPDVVADVDFGMVDWLSLLVFFTASIYMYGVVISRAHDIASGDPGEIRASLDIAARRLLVMGAVYLMYGIAIAVGTLLLIVPGIFLFVALFASLFLPIAEEKGPIDSLRESFALVRGYWWRTLAVLVMITAIMAVPSLGMSMIIVSLVTWFGTNWAGNAAWTLTYAVFAAFIVPLGTCLIYATYQDLRLRRNEGGTTA